MRLKCLISKGFLDISSQEPYQGNIPEVLPMRLVMRPGQIIDLQDEYRNIKNIDSAIKLGLLQVMDYNSNDGSLVVNAELKKPYSQIRLDDLADVNASSPNDGQSLLFDAATQTWIPGDVHGGGHALYELLRFNITPVEIPNGVNKTFTLPSSEKYITGKFQMYINGKVLNLLDFSENAGKTSITLTSAVTAPKFGDTIRMHYIKDDAVILTDIIASVQAASSLNDLMSFNVIPVGNIDGSNKTFTLPDQYIPDKIEVYLNGDVLNNTDYTQDVGYQSFTFNSTTPAPKVGDKIRVNYIKIANPFDILIFHQEPVETPNGVIKIFTLDNNFSYESGKISVTLNGQVLTEIDFHETITNEQIIFMISPPINSDIIRFYYIRRL